jgi:hypothetical protein
MPQFELKLEDELKYAYFFKGKDSNKEDDGDMDEDDIRLKSLNLLKKNYCLVSIDGRVITKNLGIRKKSNSEASKRVFQDVVVPGLKVGNSKFSKVYIVAAIKDLIKADISMALLRKEVDDVKSYANTTSLAAQLSQRYGAGIHFVIPNIKGIGAGKGKSFCTLEEFKQHNLTTDDIDYEGFIKELDYFIKPVVMKNIFEY